MSEDELNNAILLEQIEHAGNLVDQCTQINKEDGFLVQKMKSFDIPLKSSCSENKGFKSRKSSFLEAHSSKSRSKYTNSFADLLNQHGKPQKQLQS